MFSPWLRPTSSTPAAQHSRIDAPRIWGEGTSELFASFAFLRVSIAFGTHAKGAKGAKGLRWASRLPEDSAMASATFGTIRAKPHPLPVFSRPSRGPLPGRIGVTFV